MSDANDHRDDITPPKEFELPDWFNLVAGALTLIGFAAFLGGLFGFDDPRRAWQAYLIGHWFTFSLGLAGAFLVAIHYVTKAGWDTSIRRIPEAFAMYLGPAAIFSAIALAGAEHILPWIEFLAGDGHGGGDVPHYVHLFLEKKSGFLNWTGLAATSVVAPAAIFGLSYWIRRKSIEQDETADPQITETQKSLSTLYLWVFVIGFSLLSWYWLMSIEPIWFSTMFQVYTFAALFQTGLALTTIIVLVLNERDYFGDFVHTHQIHSLGQLVFAFTVFYAYVTFCQFLLIWYANKPIEGHWYVHRIMDVGGWHWFIGFWLVKFIIPFFLLLPQDIKKNAKNILFYVCILLVFAQFGEIWYWVSFAPDSVDPGAHDLVQIATPWLEFLVTLGFFGVFMWTVGWALSSAKLIPINDPFLHETLPHGHHDDDEH